MKIKKILAVIAAMTALSGLFAQSNSDRRFALVIGNQEYEESKLNNSEADARLVAEKLKNCGFDVTLALNLNKSSLSETIGEYAEKVSEGGSNTISFFYYSGHGVQIDGVNYIVPVDDKNITSAVKAKVNCYSVNSLLGNIPSKTQVVVLDACRNNPFKDSGNSYAKGLTQIATPKNVQNFLVMFSCQADKTADDGTGKNSIFTECLASRMSEMNVSIQNVFNETANDVKTQTEGRQMPLITGTSVNFELMNEEIAAAKIAALKAQMKTLDAENKVSASKNYGSEKKLLQAEMDNMNELKENAAKDAKKKAEEQKKADEIRKKNQKALEKAQKEAADNLKTFQLEKARKQSSVQFITNIENEKQRVQKIRNDAADKIYAADLSVQKSADEKKKEIMNAPLGITQQDKKGRMTSVVRKQRESECAEVQAQADSDKSKNYDRYYEAIKDEESETLNQIAKDLNTIKSGNYSASTVVFNKEPEVEYRIGTYDATDEGWYITINSNLFSRGDLYNTKFLLPYETVKTKLAGEKYIAPAKMSTNAQFDDYENTVGVYDALFHSETPPFLIEVKYTISPVSGKSSAYQMTTSKVLVKTVGEKETELVSLPYKKVSEIRWIPSTNLTDVKTILAQKEAADAAAAAEEAKRLKKEEAERARLQKAEEANLAKAEKESARQASKKASSSGSVKSSSKSSVSSSKSYNTPDFLKGDQITLNGFEAGIEAGPGFGFQAGYNWGIADHFFVGPYLGGRTIKEKVKVYTDSSETATEKVNQNTFVIMAGGVFGYTYTFDFDGHLLDPYVSMNLGVTGGSKEEVSGKQLIYVDFGLHFGAAYFFTENFSVNADIGFATAGSAAFNFNAGVTFKPEFFSNMFSNY